MIDENEAFALAALAMQGIPAHARLLLAVLTIIGEDTDVGRTVTCPLRDLAGAAGVSRRSAQRSVKTLEQAGLLIRTRRSRQDGGGAASTYTVLTAHLTEDSR